MFHESLKVDSRKIEGFLVGFKGVYRKSTGCLKILSKVFQGSFKGVSTKIEGCSQIQGSFKGI